MAIIDRQGRTVDEGDAATPDFAQSGLAIKAPARLATTGNITLSGEQTIDGVAAVANDRIMVKSQSTGSENGLYLVSTGPWTRVTDMDGSSEIAHGTQVFVTGGATLSLSHWYVSTPNPIIIDTTTITFSVLSAAGDVVGPGSATDGHVAVFDGTGGKTIEDSGVAITDLATQSFVTAAIDVVKGGVSSAFDTLSEIATELALKAYKAITLTAGAGLTGGGDLSANRTLTVGAGAGITVNADDVALTVPVAANLGGTGVANNAASTITISGSFGTTFTITGTTSVTLPTTGTLATLAGVEAFTNKSYNGNTWTAGTGVLTLGAGKTLTASNTLTMTATDGSTAAFGVGGTVAYKGLTLAQFAATTSLELKTLLSDETGSGAAVFATSPGFTTAANPISNDGAALGTTALQWSDLFLASGGVLNFNNGDVTVTHSSNVLAFAGAATGYTFDAPVSGVTTFGLTSYINLAEIASPSNPSADNLRLFAKDVAGVTHLFSRDSAGSEVDMTLGGGGSSAATQAEQEAATSTSVFVSPGRQQFHPSAPKAWASFAHSGGVPTAGESYNVSSFTDTGTGLVGINFTTAFAASSYNATALGNRVSPDAPIQCCRNGDGSITTSAYPLALVQTSTLVDAGARVGVAFQGDQ